MTVANCEFNKYGLRITDVSIILYSFIFNTGRCYIIIELEMGTIESQAIDSDSNGHLNGFQLNQESLNLAYY